MNPAGTRGRLWWDCYAAVYGWLWDCPLSDSVARAVADRIPAVGDLIVDVGTGTGLLTGRLAVVGPVLGIDGNREMLRRAARRPGRWIAAAAPYLPIRPGSATTVVATNLVHLCRDPIAVVRSLATLVRPGGRLILTWPPDDVGPVRLARAELAGGAGLPLMLAHLCVRVVVGGTAVATGSVRRTPSVRLTAAVAAIAAELDLSRSDDLVLDGLQQIVVLARPDGAPSTR